MYMYAITRSTHHHASKHSFTAITCPAPVAPSHGSAIYENTLWESDVIYRCDNGYQFGDGSQDMTATCLSTRHWNQLPTPCVGEMTTAPRSVVVNYPDNCAYIG